MCVPEALYVFYGFPTSSAVFLHKLCCTAFDIAQATLHNTPSLQAARTFTGPFCALLSTLPRLACSLLSHILPTDKTEAIATTGSGTSSPRMSEALCCRCEQHIYIIASLARAAKREHLTGTRASVLSNCIIICMSSCPRRCCCSAISGHKL